MFQTGFLSIIRSLVL